MSFQVIRTKNIQTTFKKLDSRCKSFQVFFDGSPEPEFLHIIKSGFEDLYICVFEYLDDPEPVETRTHCISSEEIKERFDIDILKEFED